MINSTMLQMLGFDPNECEVVVIRGKKLALTNSSEKETVKPHSQKKPNSFNGKNNNIKAVQKMTIDEAIETSIPNTDKDPVGKLIDQIEALIVGGKLTKITGDIMITLCEDNDNGRAYQKNTIDSYLKVVEAGEANSGALIKGKSVLDDLLKSTKKILN